MSLRAEGLQKRFGRRQVVHDVALEVHPGETVGLLGPNGAGKTTTFYMVVGIEAPDAGDVWLDDVRLTGEPLWRRARRGIRYLPQEPSVFQRMTVLDNVEAVLEVAGFPRAERRRRAEAVLADFKLDHILGQRGYMLSGGERRRLEIARAMATEPAWFLLDEPFAGIDPIAVADLQDLVRSICERGIGVLISDHNVRETLRLCDRAYVMHEGRVVVEGDAATIAADPLAREVYLGAGFEL